MIIKYNSYIKMEQGEVHMIKYITDNMPPILSLNADVSSGSAPLKVQFNLDGSYDRENDPFTFTWNFGDNSAESSDPHPIHVYNSPGNACIGL
jgi:cytochrome c